MKIKQTLHITNPEDFLRGDYDSCFGLYGRESAVNRWIICGEIEIDVDVDTGDVIQVVSDAIDVEIGKHTAMLNVLERRKSELLCLTHEKQELIQADEDAQQFDDESLDEIERTEGMKESADEILYETTRKLKDGRTKNTVTGYIEEPVTSSIDDAPVTLGSNKEW